jgi:hypothetical protein
MIRLLMALGFLLIPFAVRAQPYQVVASCDTINNSGGVGSGVNGYMDTTGHICVTGGALGTIATKPAALTILPLDIATVTTGGGAAVVAITAGHRTAGAWLQNPPTATTNLCYNELTTASGTTTAGSLICIVPGQSAVLSPSALGVSVITSDSNHAFGGYALQ